jgi:hypothetical protein
MTPAQLSRVEAGKSASPEFITVARIAAAVDMSLDEVAARSGAPGHSRPDKARQTSGPVISKAVVDLARVTKAANTMVELADIVTEVANEVSNRLKGELPNLARPKRSVR